MKRYELSMIVIAIIAAIASAAAIVSIKMTGIHDNPIEQAAEEVIKSTTGLEVDFSPEKKA